jgi:outer membrane autotransporter protein
MRETPKAAQAAQPWNVFTRGTVVLSQDFSSGGQPHSEATQGTIQAGADYQVSPNMLIGAFFGYSRSSSSLDEEGSSATANSYVPGVYASYARDGWYGNALVAGGVNQFDVSRNIQFPGFSANAQSKPNGEEEFAYLSGGRDFHSGNWTFGPTAGLQYLHMTTDSFSENGAGMLDLDVNSYSNDSLRSRLGGRVYYAASGSNIIWRPFLDASWQHEFMGNTTSLTSQFSGAGVGTFTVAAPGNSRESALISVGTDIDINETSTVFTAYRVEAGSETFFAQSVEAGFKLTF